MRYIVTICHAHPPQFTHGMGINLEGLNGEPTYYEALQIIEEAEEPTEVLEVAFTLGNVDGPEMLPDRLSHLADEVRKYRALGNRSLSVGDVVILTPVSTVASERPSAWICASLGWEQLERIPEVVPTPTDSARSAAHLAQIGATPQ